MKKQFTMMLLSICMLTLAGCDNVQKPEADIHNVRLMVDQALIIAAHGANLKLEIKPEITPQGQALLSEASSLLRRALSGPEMAMMHKGENGMSAEMKRTHDLGNAAFDLLGLMMALTPNAVNAQRLRQLNERLAIAAAGSSMLLQAESAGDFQPAMQKHARKLLQQAKLSFTDIKGKGAYSTLVGHLIEMLGKNVNQTADKS